MARRETHIERAERKKREFELAVKRTTYANIGIILQFCAFVIALVTMTFTLIMFFTKVS